MSRLTIEPAKDGGTNVYAHGTYGRESILEGQTKRSFEAYFQTRDEAVKAYPQAEVLEGSTQPFRLGSVPLAELSGLPQEPPAWFDALAAGESWGADDW